MLGKFILMLIMLGLFSIFYISLNEVYTPTYTWAQSEITDSDSVNTMSLMNVIWIWWPIAVLFSYIIYSINKARQERDVGWP